LGGLHGPRECQHWLQLNKCCLYVVSNQNIADAKAHSWPCFDPAKQSFVVKEEINGSCQGRNNACVLTQMAKNCSQGSLYLSRESLGNRFFEEFQKSPCITTRIPCDMVDYFGLSHATWWITLVYYPIIRFVSNTIAQRCAGPKETRTKGGPSQTPLGRWDGRRKATYYTDFDVANATQYLGMHPHLSLGINPGRTTSSFKVCFSF
jgi:hypothetical protein